MTLNKTLLRDTLEFIKTHPAKWNQRVWYSSNTQCGTVCCFAGWAAVLNGVEAPAHIGMAWRINPKTNETVLMDVTSLWEEHKKILDSTLHVNEYAARVLGLKEHEALALFESSTTYEYLDAAVEMLCNGGYIKKDDWTVYDKYDRPVIQHFYTESEAFVW